MKLGGDQDNQQFRNQLNDKMKKTGELMKKFTTDLEDFRNLNVSYEQTVSVYIYRLIFIRKRVKTSTKLLMNSSAR